MIHSERQKMSFNRLHQEIDLDDETIETFSISTSQKCKKMLLSVSFWSKISVITCMIAVSMDPLFLYIPFLDDEKKCLGMELRLRTIVLISRTLTDLSFIVHIIYEIRKAMKVVASMSKPMVQIGGRLKIIDWFEYTQAIAKNLSWSSFLTDILAVLPIPHVLVLLLFYSPYYGFSENKMTLNYMLLAQYLPRMYRIFLSFKKFRKNSSMWLKATFYFFMYILASHVIGAFWYFSSIQVETICWFWAINKSGPFRCDDPLLLEEAKENITMFCPTGPPDASIYDFGSFSETLSSGHTRKVRFREKLFYFAWWGLKNLSNYGTSIANSRFIWENCFAILVSGIGLVLFAILIGNMQECFQSAEEMKVISDKVQLKGEELQVWMVNNGLPEKLGRQTEKLRTEIMTNITKRMKEDKDADLENLFSLIPWNSMKSLKCVLCMSMLTKVPTLKYMDENGLRLICNYLKPVTYNEKTIVFRMGEPLDSMLLIVEGIMVIYTTSTTTDGRTLGAITGTPSTVHGSLENGSVYGHDELLSWASPDRPVTYATLPISTGNVKCLSQVEGFVLSAKDLKTVVSNYTLHWNCRNSDHVESGGGEGGTFYLERS